MQASHDRPTLFKALQEFKHVYDDIGKTVPAVGRLIGGRVDYNINQLTPAQGQFQNACAIRMSYVLNNTGFKIPHHPGKTVSGAKGHWYFYKLKDLIVYLKSIFGRYDYEIHMPTVNKLVTYKGIVIFEVDEWTDATGHATIWNGVDCSDKCYFSNARKALIWELA